MAERSLGITHVCILSLIETTFWIIIGAWYGYYVLYSDIYFWGGFRLTLLWDLSILFMLLPLILGILLFLTTLSFWKLKSWALRLTIFVHLGISFFRNFTGFFWDLDFELTWSLMDLGVEYEIASGVGGFLSFTAQTIFARLIPLIVIGYLLFMLFKEERPNFIRNLSWIDAVFWLGFGVIIALLWPSGSNTLSIWGLAWLPIVMWGFIMIFLGSLSFLLHSKLVKSKTWPLWLAILIVSIVIIYMNLIIMGVLVRLSGTPDYRERSGAFYGSLGVGYEFYILDSILWLFLDVFGSIIPIIIAVYAILSILREKIEYPPLGL